MFRLLFGIAGIMLCLGAFYLYCFLRRIECFYLEKFWNNYKKKKGSKWFERIFYVIQTVAILFFCLRVWNGGMIFLLYLIGFCILLDILNLFFRKMLKNRLFVVWRNLYNCGVIPVTIAVGVMIYGVWNMNHIVQTDYLIETDKNLREEGYRIVFISDTHCGTIQDVEVLEEAIEKIRAENPDFVILGGDMVEEGSSKEDMEAAFALFGTLEPELGIYYVYGNHDKQTYSADKAYSEQELKGAIERNGIIVLDDACRKLNDEIVIVGRADASWRNMSGRMSMEMLLEGYNQDKFILVADHQPIDTKENAQVGVDLQISGHTHAGQFWPGKYILELTGQLAYGEYQEGNCSIIVSSGATGWGYPLRTSEHCEYVMIEIQKK